MKKSSRQRLLRKILIKILRYSGLPGLLRILLQKNRISVIFYHEIDHVHFEQHLKFILKHYHVISITELFDFLEGRIASLPDHSILITFDDGHAGNYLILDICRKYNIRPVVFLITAMVDNPSPFWFKLPFQTEKEKENLKCIPDTERLKYLNDNYDDELKKEYRQSLTWSQVVEMLEWFDFQSHTHTHPCLPNCTMEVVYSELVQSKKLIEEKLNTDCHSLAYPNGDYNKKIPELCMQAGYHFAFTGRPGLISKKTKKYELPRMSMNDTENQDEFIVRLSGLWFLIKIFLQFFKRKGHDRI